MSKLTQCEKCQYILFILYFSFPFWFNLFVSRLPGATYIAHFILILPAVCILIIRNRKSVELYYDIVLLYLLVFFLFLFQFWGNSKLQPWISENVYSVKRFMLYPASGIFAYAVIRLSERKDLLLKALRIVGFLLFIYYAIQSIEVIRTGVFVYDYFGTERSESYNISWGYGMLSAIAFLTADYMKFRKKLVIPFIVVGFLGIVLYGSRTPAVIYLCMILMMIIFYGDFNSKTNQYKKRVLPLIIIMLVLIWLFAFGGLTWIANLLSDAGLTSRTLTSLLEGTIGDDNGRNEIWEVVIELIKEHPLLGNGVFGERNAVYNAGYRWGYAHQIFLELLVDFGVIFGSAIIILLACIIVKMLIRPADKDYQLLIIVFLTISMELLVSNSFWFHMGFWGILALAMNARKDRKKIKIQAKDNL